LIVTEFQKINFFNSASQSELFRANPKPFTGDCIFLAVIIPKLQMLFEVFFGIAQVGLNLGGQHPVFLRHFFGLDCNGILTTRRSGSD
jgi:hypothetical protein